MQRNKSIALVLALCLFILGPLAGIALAQDSGTNTYVPLITRFGSPAEYGPTALPTPTLPPDATPTPTPTLPPGVTPSPTPTFVPGVTPTITPTASPTPARPPSSECVQYGAGVRRSSHFGVQMYDDTGPDREFFEPLVASKSGWVRTLVPWAQTERENTTPDQYNWERIDNELEASKHVNVQMIGTISFAPRWAASAPNGPINLTSLDEFAQFAAAVVERYDGDGLDDAPCSPRVKHWELYNEPDNRYSWGNYPAEYAQMMAALYPAMKAADPEARILFGGVAQDWFVDQDGVFVRNWVEQVLAAGGGPYFDVMNIHNYAGYFPERADHFPGTIEKVDEFRQIMRDYGFDKPIMITETGDHATSSDGWLAHRQSIYLTQIFTQARVSGVEAVTWFTLYDLEGYPRYTGLVKSDNPPSYKPAFDAFLAMSDFYEYANYVRTLTPETDGGDGYMAYEFDDPVNNRKLIVGWTYWDAEENVSTQLTFDATSAIRFNIYGNATPLNDGSDGANDGRITVTFDKEPFILQLPR